VSRLRPAALLLAWVLCGGCSVQFAYNNLDRLARWSVNDYLDMNERQRSYFDAAVTELWAWHRSAHLPRYAAWLDGLQETLGDGTSEAELQRLVDQVLAWAREIEQRGRPAAAELLLSLSEEQVARLARRLEERNREIAEPELDATPEQARQGWQDELVDRFTELSGRLNSAQLAYVATQSVRYVPERVLWAEYRRRWQEDFLELLRSGGEVTAFTTELGRLMDERERYYGAELAAVFDNNEQLTAEVSVWLINSLTERQRQRFFERLAELAEDFRQLAAQDPAPLPQQRPCLVSC
jgi:hypothetical protein